MTWSLFHFKILEGYINNGDTIGIQHALTTTRKEGFSPVLRVLERAMVCAERQQDSNLKQLIRKELLTAGHRFGIETRAWRGGRGGGFNRGYRGGPRFGYTDRGAIGPNQGASIKVGPQQGQCTSAVYKRSLMHHEILQRKGMEMVLAGCGDDLAPDACGSALVGQQLS